MSNQRHVARVLAVFIAFGCVAQFACAQTVAGRVIRVSDGDTLTIQDVHQRVYRVRLDEIDAPELGQAFGKRSRESLAEMCSDKTAYVVTKGADRYGRTLGRVRCAGVDANSEQVRRGMAWVFDRYVRSNSPLYALQWEAQAIRRGLWSDPQPTAPWRWRKTPKRDAERT
jgi:endonuclease YncB( thermonuclease family)